MEIYRIFIGNSNSWEIGSPAYGCGVYYTGYRKEIGAITRERGMVVITCSTEECKAFASKIEDNSVLLLKGEKQQGRFLVNSLQDVLEISADPTPEEAKFLEAELQPTRLADEVFGELVFDKTINSYEGKLQWQEKQVRLHLGHKESLGVLRQIYKDFANFLEKAEQYAARELLELADDWCRDAWEDEKEEKGLPENAEDSSLTEKEFMHRMTLQELVVEENGEYSLWYNDGDMFWGHAIVVYGNLKDGFTDASMQG